MQTKSAGGDPEHSFIILVDGSDIVAGQAVAIALLVLVADNFSGGWIEAIQASPFCANGSRADP